jgi:hypothetical protein
MRNIIYPPSESSAANQTPNWDNAPEMESSEGTKGTEDADPRLRLAGITL